MYEPPVEYGQPCPKCGQVLQVVNTIAGDEFRVRYIGCRGCGYRPESNTWTVPIAHAPARRMRRRTFGNRRY